MIFTCDQTRYDTQGMLQYETTDPQVPLIYALPDFSRVFVVTFDHERGVDVHIALPEEIRLLARLYALPDLLQAAAETLKDPPPN